MSVASVLFGVLLLGLMFYMGSFDLLSQLEWPGEIKKSEAQAAEQQTPLNEVVAYTDADTGQIWAEVLQIERTDSLITGMVRPETATGHVQDILSLNARKEIYARDRDARSQISEFADENYPIDAGTVLAGDERTMDLNLAVWTLLYVRHEQEICHEYGIPEWMLFQIIGEGDQHFWWFPEQ